MKADWKNNLVAAGVLAAVLAPAGLTLAAGHAPAQLAKHEAADTDTDLPGVNPHAKRVEQSDTEAEFKVPADGQVWLYDATDKSVEHSISVREGNTYAFNTKKNAVYVNGKEGAKVDLTPKHTYRIYFVSNADRGGPAREADLVPHTATVVAEGRGKDLIYKATSGEGIVYLWDRTNHELVNTFHVMKNQVLAIEPKKNRIALEDKVIVKDADLKTDADYRLLFDAKHAR